MSKEELIKKYSQLLPQRIDVHSEGANEEGFWAKVTAPGTDLQNCYTEAASIPELILMVNDAVKTHFEIPEDIREEVGFYAPLPDNHLRMEEMFNKLVLMGNQEGRSITSLELQTN